MTFDEAHLALSLGDHAAVRMGGPAPQALPDSVEYKIWKSNNFDGCLMEKGAGFLRFDLDCCLVTGNQIGYVITEGRGHSFELLA